MTEANFIALAKKRYAEWIKKRYKNVGVGLIGSGAIESAHRTVVQKRMKQSGQRWSNKGAQNMLNPKGAYNEWAVA